MKLPLRYVAPTIRDANDHAILDMVYGTDVEREANALTIIAALENDKEETNGPKA